MRPLDIYVAFLVFLMGLYGLLDPNWPPNDARVETKVILIAEDIYLAVAGLVIVAAFILRGRIKCVICSLVMEQFGWLFVSAASFIIAISSPWVPPSVFVESDKGDASLLAVWVLIWLGLGAASLTRYLDMRSWFRGGAQ